MPEVTTNNTAQPSGLSTTEGAAREGQLARENNFSSVTGPAIPAITQYSPNVSTDWMYEEIPMPSYAELKMGAGNGIKQIQNGITAKGNDSPDFFYGRAGRYETASNPYDPYNYKVPVNETHTMLHSGKWISRYPRYFRGINNEDLYARQQSTSQKFWNGIAKFGAKVGINVLGNLTMLPDKIISAAREGSVKAALNTDWEKTLDDWTTQTDYSLPHYYRQETNDYNLWQKMWKDSGNFIMNDVLGNGMAFTVGAMVTGLATGGLGIGASSLGRLGARLGMRYAARGTMRAAGKAASTAARDAARRATGNVKSLLNESVRRGASIGRTAGEAVGTLNTLAMTSAYEASVEANDFMNTSKEDFINYYNQVYGRNPSQEEMADFMESTRDVASWVFGANLGIVGLSNWLLFGKYIGMGGQFIPGLNGRLGKVFSNVGTAAGNASRGVKKTLFGLGTEVKAPGQYAIKVSSQNLAQKIAAHTFNVAKRPISEGLFEEGLQGVAQNAAEEYIKSRYDSINFENAISGLDAIGEGFQEQYTSKEGWTEIGIGAIIGSIFGIKQGLGFTENSQNRKRLSKLVDEYNKQADNLNKAALNTIKQAIHLSPQMNLDADNMTSRDYDDAVFAKMSLEDQLGILGDSRKNFKAILDGISNEALAKEMHITEEAAQQYKDQLLRDYDIRMDIYNDAAEFAASVVGDDSKPEFKDYIARNAYLGMMAYERLGDIAGEIEKLSGRSDIRAALSTYSNLSEKARKAARDMVSIRDRVAEIENQLQQYASRPRVVGETDPLADEIRRKTGELERERNSLLSQMDRLSKMVGQEFDVNNFRATRDRLLGDTSSLLGPISAQEIMDAYDALSAFDDYFVNMRANQSETTHNRALSELLREYRENLIDYRNMNNFLMKMLDKRFMADEYKGFTSLLKDIWSVPYSEEQEGAQPWFVKSGSLGKYAADDAVDKALQEGSITEDEAFTIKAFMHSADRLRSNAELLNRPNIERISDEEMEAWRNFDPANTTATPVYGTDENGNPTVDFNYDVNPNTETRDRIVSAYWMDNEKSLTPREREIYEAQKDYFDRRIASLPASPKTELERLRKRVDDMTSIGALIRQNNAVIDFVRDQLSTDESRENLDKAIGRYNDLYKKSHEEGLDTDEEAEMESLRNEINQIGAEVLGDLQNASTENVLTDFIDQNHLLERNKQVAGETVSDYGNNVDQLDDITSGETTDEEEANTERMQNPSTLMGRLVDDGDGPAIEVSGLQAPVLLGVGKPCRIRLLDGTVLSEDAIRTTEENGIKRWHITLPSGTVVALKETKNHARFRITTEDAGALAAETNFVVANIGTAYQVIYERVLDGSNTLKPFRSDVGYGENESEVIDENALSRINQGDSIEFEVDTNDPFNKALFKRYQSDIENGMNPDEARQKLANSLVIKIYTEQNGVRYLVSVVKANFGDLAKDSMGIRRNAADLVIKKGESGGKLTVRVKGNPKADTPLPGHPNFTLQDNGDGTYSVTTNEITEEGAKNVYGVGYVMNGEVHMRTEDGKDDFMRYPYASRIIRKSKEAGDGVKYPVIAITLPNGRHVLYPVQLKTVQNEEAEQIVQSLNDAINGLNDNAYVELDSEFVRQVNAFMLRAGLDPTIYQLGFTANLASTVRKCADEIQRVGSRPDVDAWIDDKSRSIRDVAMGDILTNIDLAGTMFVAPMLRVRFRGSGNTEFPEGEPDGTEAPVGGAEPATPTPVQGPITPENPGGEFPFGPGGTAPGEGTGQGGGTGTAGGVGTGIQPVRSLKDIGVIDKINIADEILSEYSYEGIPDIAVMQWAPIASDKENRLMDKWYGRFNIQIPAKEDGMPDYRQAFEGVIDALTDVFSSRYRITSGNSEGNINSRFISVIKKSDTSSGANSASNLADVSDNSEARTIQNKPC